MGKHKKRSHEKIRKKLKKIEKYLQQNSSSDSNEELHRRYDDSPSPKRRRRHTPSVPSDCEPYLSEEDHTFDEKPDSPNENQPPDGPDKNLIPVSVPENAETSIPQDILEALGDPKTKNKEEVFGPSVPEEMAKRWGRVLVDGLNKDQKQSIIEKTLVPENFKLVKAPLLNLEIAAVLSDPVKNRDKLIETSQNQLGLGIAGLTNLAAAIIEEDLGKIELIKRISDINQIFLDLHNENSKTRRKLIISSLDKKFINMISGVKRDAYLFGENLGEKIKASKTAERSGLQIKRTDNTTYPKKTPQGNWKGPPRSNTHRPYRQGGPKNRYFNNPANKRTNPQPAADRTAAAATSSRPPARPRKA